jgi:hypothetical protein
VPRSEPRRPDSHVRSRRRSASDRACPSVRRRRRLRCLSMGKCSALPRSHAEPAALTSLPPSPSPSHLSSIFPRRSPQIRACPSAVHASPSMSSTPHRLPRLTLPVSSVPHSLHRSQPSCVGEVAAAEHTCRATARTCCAAARAAPRRAARPHSCGRGLLCARAAALGQ